MAKLGTTEKPARVRVQTEERAIELVNLCNAKGWQVIVGIEPDKPEDADDIRALENGIKPAFIFKASPSRNVSCPCGSGKQFKRCCGK